MYSEEENERIRKSNKPRDTKPVSIQKKGVNNCIWCNGKGYVIAISGGNEYAVDCTCNGGAGLNWKYPKDMILTEEENVLYLKIKETGELPCPF